MAAAVEPLRLNQWYPFELEEKEGVTFPNGKWMMTTLTIKNIVSSKIPFVEIVFLKLILTRDDFSPMGGALKIYLDQLNLRSDGRDWSDITIDNTNIPEEFARELMRFITYKEVIHTPSSDPTIQILNE